MTRTRWLILAFWIVIVGMLIKQLIDKNAQLAAHPADQQHFFFTPVPGQEPPPPPVPGADVRETGFAVEPDTPSPGNFTCHVTLQNQGSTKAIGVQLHVLPYRNGSLLNTETPAVNHSAANQWDLSHYGVWLAFPDLAPGQSSTQSTIFLAYPNVRPGEDPHPEIIFKADKPNP
jgi:hypothetical protein